MLPLFLCFFWIVSHNQNVHGWLYTVLSVSGQRLDFSSSSCELVFEVFSFGVLTFPKQHPFFQFLAFPVLNWKVQRSSVFNYWGYISTFPCVFGHCSLQSYFNVVFIFFSSLPVFWRWKLYFFFFCCLRVFDFEVSVLCMGKSTLNARRIVMVCIRVLLTRVYCQRSGFYLRWRSCAVWILYFIIKLRAIYLLSCNFNPLDVNR